MWRSAPVESARASAPERDGPPGTSQCVACPGSEAPGRVVSTLVFSEFSRSVFRTTFVCTDIISNNFRTILRHPFAFRTRRPFWDAFAATGCSRRPFSSSPACTAQSSRTWLFSTVLYFCARAGTLRFFVVETLSIFLGVPLLCLCACAGSLSLCLASTSNAQPFGL